MPSRIGANGEAASIARDSTPVVGGRWSGGFRSGLQDLTDRRPQSTDHRAYNPRHDPQALGAPGRRACVLSGGLHADGGDGHGDFRRHRPADRSVHADSADRHAGAHDHDLMGPSLSFSPPQPPPPPAGPAPARRPAPPPAPGGGGGGADHGTPPPPPPPGGGAAPEGLQSF